MKITTKLKYKINFLNYFFEILKALFSNKDALNRSLLLSKKDGFEYDPIGMTDLNEQKLFYFTTCKLFTGKGNIIDLGCWLGSTTEQLANGLQNSKKKLNEFQLIAYDRFEWENWMNNPNLDYLTKDLVVGNDFQNIFIDKVSKKYPIIKPIKADLLNYSYEGKQIEILLIDVMKSVELVEVVAKNFCTKVIEDGYIIHQDFAHEWTPWIHIHLYENRHLLDFKYYAFESGSAIYKIKGNEFVNIKSLSSYSVELLEQIFNYSIKKVTSIHHQDKIRCAFIFSLLWSDRKEVAREKLYKYFDLGYSQYGPLKSALNEIENQ